MNVRPWFRFSLGTLLFLTSCLAGFFAGYHNGRRAGVEYWNGEKPVGASFRVADLLPAKIETAYRGEAKALIKHIEISLNGTYSPTDLSRPAQIASRPLTEEWLYISLPRRQVPDVDALLNSLREKKKLDESLGRTFRIADQL